MTTIYCISEPVVYGVIWGFFGLASCFFVGRIYVRWRVYGKLHLDDYFAILAIVSLLAEDIAVTLTVPIAKKLEPFTVYKQPPPPNFTEMAESYATHEWGVAYLYFTGIWAVKGVFLAFYGKLTEGLRIYRRLWWVLVVFTGLTYVGALFAYAFLEGVHKTRVDKSFKTQAINYQFSVDLTTDLCITALPLALALRTSVPLRKKLALTGIFSLGLVSTVFAIIRYAVDSPLNVNSNYGGSWILTWSTVEESVAVCAACAASFRTFLVDRQRRDDDQRLYYIQRTDGGGTAQSGSRRWPGTRQDSFNALMKNNLSHGSSSTRVKSALDRSEDSIDEVELLEPPNAIGVRHDVSVRSSDGAWQTSLPAGQRPLPSAV